MASWQISALIEGVLLIWHLSRHCKAQILLGICMLVYVTVHYRSSLYSVFSCGNMGASLIAAYEKVASARTVFKLSCIFLLYLERKAIS